jgi:hypothetical protein
MTREQVISWWNSLSEEKKEFLQFKYNLSIVMGRVGEEIYNEEHKELKVPYYNSETGNTQFVNWNDHDEVNKVFLNKRNILFNDKRFSVEEVKQWIKPLAYINFTFICEEVFWSMETGTVLITRLEWELSDLIRKEFNKVPMTGLEVHRLKYLQNIYTFCKQKMIQNEMENSYKHYENEFSDVKQRITDVEGEFDEVTDKIYQLSVNIE